MHAVPLCCCTGTCVDTQLTDLRAGQCHPGLLTCLLSSEVTNTEGPTASEALPVTWAKTCEEQHM
jgi:hypothetical protein